MNSQTISVAIAATPARVYAFAADPANLPAWAPAFCQSVACVDGVWVVQSPLGAVQFAFAPPNDYGVLDHTVTLSSGARLINPMRVIPNGAGSEVLFTLFQHEGMSDGQFGDDAALVRSDLETLRRLCEDAGE
jgi:hypothetical protein